MIALRVASSRFLCLSSFAKKRDITNPIPNLSKPPQIWKTPRIYPLEAQLESDRSPECSRRAWAVPKKEVVETFTGRRNQRIEYRLAWLVLGDRIAHGRKKEGRAMVLEWSSKRGTQKLAADAKVEGGEVGRSKSRKPKRRKKGGASS